VTVELRGETDVDHQNAEQDAKSILSYLAHVGQIDMAVPSLPTKFFEATPLDAVLPVLAPHAGILVLHKRLGTSIEKGESIGEIIDPMTGKTSALISSIAGKLFATTAHRFLHRGDTVAKIAGSISFRSGDLLTA